LRASGKKNIAPALRKNLGLGLETRVFGLGPEGQKIKQIKEIKIS